MRTHILVLGLALPLMACGDDSVATRSDAGNTGGGAGGTGGRAAISCPDEKRDTLEAFCQDNETCKLSVSERWKKICTETTCSTSDCYFSARNSCGGFSISHVTGVDVYSDTYHYAADGTLVGVKVQARPAPCARGRDQYGTDCQHEDEGRLDCEPDAG